MSILLSGDFHANAREELNQLTRESLIARFGQKKFDAIRYHVILGDAGFLWPHNDKKDLFNFEILGKRTFPILCVVGNHEPILGMTDIPEVDIGIGETVYQIHDDPQVAYLKRGKVYTFDGFKFLVLGGALSVDKSFRVPKISWWEKEYWTEQEKEDVFKLLEKDNTFDYVLSHTGPHRINHSIFARNGNIDKFEDEVAFLNDKIDAKIKCDQWWCGHWHQDYYYFDEEMNRGYQYLYYTPRILRRRKNGVVIYH
jgi:3-oxoacid CoA-transferase subunit A